MWTLRALASGMCNLTVTMSSLPALPLPVPFLHAFIWAFFFPSKKISEVEEGETTETVNKNVWLFAVTGW